MNPNMLADGGCWGTALTALPYRGSALRMQGAWLHVVYQCVSQGLVQHLTSSTGRLGCKEVITMPSWPVLPAPTSLRGHARTTGSLSSYSPGSIRIVSPGLCATGSARKLPQDGDASLTHAASKAGASPHLLMATAAARLQCTDLQRLPLLLVPPALWGLVKNCLAVGPGATSSAIRPSTISVLKRCRHSLVRLAVRR